MSNFVIVTDSCADLTAELVNQLDVKVIPLTYMIDEKEYRNDPVEPEMDTQDFYNLLREGKNATTAAVNVGVYTEVLEPLLAAGNDVLVLAFSSGLSTTYNSSRIAVEELSEKYPERKLYTVDTLCASLGQGLLVAHAARKRAEGMDIEQVRDWVEANKLNLCHQFTVDDLFFLKRGGRVSAATAVVGTMLAIKPVMHVDDEGHLIKVGTARGRSASIKAIVDQMEKTAIDPTEQIVYICHGDCIDDANKLADMVRERFGVKEVMIGYTGPVIGSHSGPGTLALFWLGTKR
ncbi:MAG: DegV family protein [Oscillospiraceae bacterium]|nr:DegV family protein [Oscillospiraceae bacterium]